MIECGCGTQITRISHYVERRYVLGHNGRKRDTLTCATCGQEYPKRKGGLKYCSRTCSGAARQLAKVDLVCLVCGEDYPMFPYRAETSKYCSKACWSRRAEIKTCLACGDSFTGCNTKYCSKACASRHMVGERAAQWKGGATLINERARRSGSTAAVALGRLSARRVPLPGLWQQE
jgi:hypothetical protein